MSVPLCNSGFGFVDGSDKFFESSYLDANVSTIKKKQIIKK